MKNTNGTQDIREVGKEGKHKKVHSSSHFGNFIFKASLSFEIQYKIFINEIKRYQDIVSK